MRRLAMAMMATLMLAGCSATGPMFTELETPTDDESIIYYLRAKKFTGGAVFYTINEDGKPVTTLKNGGYFPHHTMPGDKHIEATTESTSELEITAEKGKRHYVYGDISYGILMGRPELREIDEEEAIKYLRGCRLLPKAE